MDSTWHGLNKHTTNWQFLLCCCRCFVSIRGYRSDEYNVRTIDAISEHREREVNEDSAQQQKKKQNKKHRNLICTTSLSWISEEQTKRVIQFKQMEYIFYLKFRSIPLNYLASICFVLFCFVLFCLDWFCSWTIAASRFHGLFQFNLWFNFQPFFWFLLFVFKFRPFINHISHNTNWYPNQALTFLFF